jgi:pimeloyl-ACP methyl ester carboxylesterase
MPALLLSGSESRENLIAANRELALVMPHAEVGVLEGQGHIATVTAPQTFADVVGAFLGSG